MKNNNFELNLLAEISKVLTENSNPSDIVLLLSKIFSDFADLSKLSIFIYDENTKLLKDYSKSWVVIDEFHKNFYTDKLYIALANFSQWDFYINDKKFKTLDFKFSGEIKLTKDINKILIPLKRKNKPYGIVELSFSGDISKLLTYEFFIALSVVSYQLSLKIQNTILAEQMQTNIDFHDAMKNIAKIIETQYELNYIIPLIGEMIDRFISEHLVYIFLKNEKNGKIELFWPRACRDKKILSAVSKVNTKSKITLLDDEKIGIFPLIGEKTLLGCIVAHSNVDKLTKNEIEYLEQLSKQSSITIHRAEVYAEVLQHATLDALTGLNNRRQFEMRLKQEYSTAKRQHKPLCAMMIDVDFFKKVNDTYGHNAGDCVLKNVANLIKAGLRDYDIASRYGGEEFAVLLPYTKIEEAFAVAQRLRQSIEKAKIDISGEGDVDVKPISVTISIGLYQFKSEDSLEILYQNADKALYDAKTHGRNKVVIFK
ncbi:MAG TPA: sensor domain-containing diguanylate cyclase [Candidatus Gastranaerophilaceae bacterium]|nr:sensor domain-containing diguanylate cyclase [Candidatus Gastranaerophilaceae bacterium]HPT40981.1 sensor domain-containing diguanylate cyclase [Candidatus Gastranaerophilaceae bacterium]